MELIVYEDEHILVVNKPAGMNTHSPSPYAVQGIYEWLKDRKPGWANLAIIHRLDKDTSGLMVFGKTGAANRSLTTQFATRKVHKKYLLQTDRRVSFDTLTARSCWARVGDRYCSRPIYPGGELAETRFRRVDSGSSGLQTIEATPVTGRTHQIRVHAAEHGFPILGDLLYGGSTAPRLHLHAAELTFSHPATSQPLTFKIAAKFEADPAFALRAALLENDETNAYRLIHGVADGYPGLFVDRLGDFLLAQSERALTPAEKELLAQWMKKVEAQGVYHRLLRRHVQRSSIDEASPTRVFGIQSPQEVVVQENGQKFALRFDEGYSVGLFLDQRENRRALLSGRVGSEFKLPCPASGPASHYEVLNAFAYTCGFSVCAAQAGARVTSLDLSRKYLDWGQRNFVLNGLNPGEHEFIFGDVFEWFRRLGKKGRLFDVILLDPPTFSRSREQGVFQAEKDYGKLVSSALPLLRPSGTLFASTNAATLKPEEFLKMVRGAIAGARRVVLQESYVAQPADFPTHRSQPPYLKTVWLRVR